MHGSREVGYTESVKSVPLTRELFWSWLSGVGIQLAVRPAAIRRPAIRAADQRPCDRLTELEEHRDDPGLLDCVPVELLPLRRPRLAIDRHLGVVNPSGPVGDTA